MGSGAGNDSTRVSIVMPVYNAQAFLPQSVCSVLEQRYRNIELLLVDDGSTDESGAICDKFAARDTRVRVLPKDKGGPAAARNWGVQHASGELVYFLDADDYLLPDAIDPLVAHYRQSNADMVLANFAKQDHVATPVRQPVCFAPDAPVFAGSHINLLSSQMSAFVRHFLKHPSNHLISYCWSRLYKTELIRKHQIASCEKMALFEDYVFNLKYLRHVSRVGFVNQHRHVYCLRPDHVSASMAVIDAAQLVHDMRLFQQETAAYLGAAPPLEGFDDQAHIAHALTHYAIIFLVRSCRVANRANWIDLHRQVKRLVASTVFRQSLRGYHPQRGNSRLVPWLARLGLITPLMLHCRHKAFKRYGRPLNNSNKEATRWGTLTIS